jgi:hypothetical protein
MDRPCHREPRAGDPQGSPARGLLNVSERRQRHTYTFLAGRRQRYTYTVSPTDDTRYVHGATQFGWRTQPWLAGYGGTDQ